MATIDIHAANPASLTYTVPNNSLQVWDITTGHCLHTLKGSNKHQSAVTSLQFTDNFVVTSSDDGSVKLWDLKTGDFVRNLVNLESGGNGNNI